MPLIVNVMGSRREEVGDAGRAFAERDEVAALELNVSCPNVKTGLVMGADPAETAALLDAVRPLTAKPLIVKLTPNCASPAAVAAAAEAHGADAVSLINTLRGMAMHPRRPGEPVAGRRDRRRVGPGVRAVALAQVARGARARRDPDRRHGRRPARAPRARPAATRAPIWSAVGTEIFRDPLAGARIAARAGRGRRNERRCIGAPSRRLTRA